jgi:hypothetical protein
VGDDAGEPFLIPRTSQLRNRSRSPSLILPFRQQLPHAFPQGISDQEIRLRIAELVVAMTWIGGVFRPANEIVRPHEPHVARELWALRCRGLGFAQDVPFAWGFDPWPG